MNILRQLLSSNSDEGQSTKQSRETFKRFTDAKKFYHQLELFLLMTDSFKKEPGESFELSKRQYKNLLQSFPEIKEKMGDPETYVKKLVQGLINEYSRED